MDNKTTPVLINLLTEAEDAQLRRAIQYAK